MVTDPLLDCFVHSLRDQIFDSLFDPLIGQFFEPVYESLLGPSSEGSAHIDLTAVDRDRLAVDVARFRSAEQGDKLADVVFAMTNPL